MVLSMYFKPQIVCARLEHTSIFTGIVACTYVCIFAGLHVLFSKHFILFYTWFVLCSFDTSIFVSLVS